MPEPRIGYVFLQGHCCRVRLLQLFAGHVESCVQHDEASAPGSGGNANKLPHSYRASSRLQSLAGPSALKTQLSSRFYCNKDSYDAENLPRNPFANPSASFQRPGHLQVLMSLSFCFRKPFRCEVLFTHGIRSRHLPRPFCEAIPFHEPSTATVRTQVLCRQNIKRRLARGGGLTLLT